MELLELNRNHPLILGTNNENLPRVISIIGEALSREAVDKESDCYPRMLNIVRQLQVSTVHCNNSMLFKCLLVKYRGLHYGQFLFKCCWLKISGIDLAMNEFFSLFICLKKDD